MSVSAPDRTAPHSYLAYRFDTRFLAAHTETHGTSRERAKPIRSARQEGIIRSTALTTMPLFTFLHDDSGLGRMLSPRDSAAQDKIAQREVQQVLDECVLRLLDGAARDALCALNEELASADLSRVTRFSKLFAEIHWTHSIVGQQVEQHAAQTGGVMGFIAGLAGAVAPENSAEEQLHAALRSGDAALVRDRLGAWPNPLEPDTDGNHPVHPRGLRLLDPHAF